MTVTFHYPGLPDSTETFNITLDGLNLAHPASQPLNVTLDVETVNITRTGSFVEFNETIETPSLLWIDNSSVHRLALPADSVAWVLCIFFGAFLFSRVLR